VTEALGSTQPGSTHAGRAEPHETATGGPGASGTGTGDAAIDGASLDNAELTGAWRDPARPVAERVADLLSRMTLEEKLAQLASVWMGAAGQGDAVAPMQDMFSHEMPAFDDLVKYGLGQLTRVYGTRPVEPAAGMAALAGLQEKIVAASRFGIPAVAHEECLTGLAAWRATIFPAPPCWGAAFDPVLVREMARSFGSGMRALGIHQGLAPVLDVTRDPRWGRTEETIGEDPYLVGTIGSAYVTGLQESGVQATLKHFAAYSATRAARNQAPASIGPRELADVILPPFEMALRAGARSVMPAYNDIDGVPASGDPELLTGLLRDRLGFSGVVVSDYYAISFLQLQHKVAASPGAAGGIALAAGIDVELPSVRCYGAPLREAVLSGEVPESLVDRAAARVLTQKIELGLLDPGWVPVPAAQPPDLDSPASRAIARRLAEESVILLANDGGALPLAASAKVAVIGPLADDRLAFFGCYSLPRHLGPGHPEAADSVAVTTVLQALRGEIADVTYARGCEVMDASEAGFPEAVATARSADVVVAVVGDVAGLFGRGTSGEGCDAADLTLPGAQQALLHALADTGKPVIGVFVTGRPYSIGSVAGRLAAVVQAFFPGEEGGTAIAGVLTGRVNPSGKLPMEIPGAGSPQPSSYLRPANAARHGGSAVDPTPLYPFGHGLSYTTFGYEDLVISAAAVPTDGTVEISCTVRNTGERAGDEIVQLYLSDPVAQVVRPLRWLAGYARVPLAPGEARRVTFRLHADRTSFSGLAGEPIVEPGEIGVAVGGSSASAALTGSFTLTGPARAAGAGRVLDTPVLTHALP
jgi:beta-xylosidase